MARVPPQYRHIWQSTWLCVCNNIQTVHGIPTGLASQTDSPMATAMRAIACHKDSKGASSALCPSEYTVHAALQHGHLYSLEWSGVDSVWSRQCRSSSYIQTTNITRAMKGHLLVCLKVASLALWGIFCWVPGGQRSLCILNFNELQP